MPGYAECFSDLWDHRLALPLARVCPPAEVLRQEGAKSLLQVIKDHQLSMRRDCFAKVLVWAQAAPTAPPQHELLRQFLATPSTTID